MTKKEKHSPVLVPVDFSDYSEAALLCASDLADMLGSPLVILHVVHDPASTPGYYRVKGRNKTLSRMEDLAAGMLEDFLQHIRKEHPERSSLQEASTVLVSGLPVNRILETAKKNHARMIVMGSQGRTGLAHIMLGSKAEQVVRLSPIPVTIVKGDNKKKS